MKHILKQLKDIFSKKKQEDLPADIQDLRIAFKGRYQNFKLILTANNKALEVMASLEEALIGIRPFGMSFIKSCCVSISVNVYLLIRNLNELSNQKYTALFERFDDIQKKILDIINSKKIIKEDNRLVIPLGNIDKEMADFVGSKMANLGELKNKLQLKTPSGFVISAAAYEKFIHENNLQIEIDKLINYADANDMEDLYTTSVTIQHMIMKGKIPKELEDEINFAWNELEKEAGRPVSVALRSSAFGEDSSGSSFAGQYRSELNVSEINKFKAYKEVIASKYSIPAITYRLNKGFKDEDIAMCVGCLVMVDAVAGGVVYSRNPVDARDDSIYMNSALGLPKAVVDGSVACDQTVVSRDSMKVVYEQIADKEKKYVCLPESGVCTMELSGEDKLLPAITHEIAVELAQHAVSVEKYYGSAQDIEWAIDASNSLYFLQCRPLQQMDEPSDKYPEELKRHLTDSPDTIIAKGGITASPGIACGPVFLAVKGSDILGFEQGSVLVTQQALPAWASVLSKAAAVVTEQGGFAGHLANVAREFSVPALFGIEGITSKVKNGDTITVDAKGLSIYHGRIDALLDLGGQKKHILMQGSPVYDILQQVGDLIVPLNLLDPDAHDFKPGNCQTFHDITRFVHEKSVFEMFNFGKEHHFAERSAKQLFYKVPMQWWILNLDDGFNEEIQGKYVKIENIVSVPMLALWQGIIAVNWDGPPIDGKGLASVMFQATANTALNTGVRSKYNDQNYFMISKNYCSLSSRLGFHFSTLEALVSERDLENYISFRFKGGAADHERKINRVHFIKKILEEYGFKVEIKEDSLTARMEGFPAEFMKERLKILGYLTIHTRQLDMIMSNPARIKYYASKLRSDIDNKVLAKLQS